MAMLHYFKRLKTVQEGEPNTVITNEQEKTESRPSTNVTMVRRNVSQSANFSKKKYELTCVRTLKDHWKNEFPWVRHDRENDLMYCSVCRKYPAVADRKSALFVGCGGGGKYRRDTLVSLNASKEHFMCQTREQNEKSPDEIPMVKAVTRLSEIKEKQMKTLFNTAF